MVPHRLKSKDPANRRGVCSICGPTNIVRITRGSTVTYKCGTKHADDKAKYRNRHRRRHYPPSPHALTWRDIELGIGLCPIDGEVAIVPFARGWTCKIRATELGGWRSKPALKCAVCGKYDTRYNPVTPTSSTEAHCETCRELLRNGPTPRDLAVPLNLGLAFGKDTKEANVGAHYVVDADWLNPDFVPDVENAVPGWKTLGER